MADTLTAAAQPIVEQHSEPVNYKEALQYFMSIDLTEYKKQVVLSFKDKETGSAKTSLMCCSKKKAAKGPSGEHNEITQQRQTLLAFAKIPYN